MAGNKCQNYILMYLDIFLLGLDKHNSQPRACDGKQFRRIYKLSGGILDDTIKKDHVHAYIVPRGTYSSQYPKS